MIRGIVGVIAGTVLGTILIFLLEVVGHHVYPFPPGSIRTIIRPSRNS
jgi:hypothetical protein